MSMTGVPLQTLASYLDSLLNLAEIPDESNAVNGLQVSNRGEIRRLFAAVDASQDTIDVAAKAGSGTLILVHHGLFWDGNVAVTGRRYRRLRALFEHDLALYSAHIPLDVHPELGNNVALAERIGIPVRGWFGHYKGIALGVWGDCELPRESLVRRLEKELAVGCKLIPGGPERTARVGIISGAGGTMVGQAVYAGLDTYITGEGPHHTYFDATEGGVNLIYAGHYATETLGVRALAAQISDRFGIPHTFVEAPTGL